MYQTSATRFSSRTLKISSRSEEDASLVQPDQVLHTDSLVAQIYLALVAQNEPPRDSRGFAIFVGYARNHGPLDRHSGYPMQPPMQLKLTMTTIEAQRS